MYATPLIRTRSKTAGHESDYCVCSTISGHGLPTGVPCVLPRRPCYVRSAHDHVTKTRTTASSSNMLYFFGIGIPCKISRSSCCVTRSVVAGKTAPLVISHKTTFSAVLQAKLVTSSDSETSTIDEERWATCGLSPWAGACGSWSSSRRSECFEPLLRHHTAPRCISSYCVAPPSVVFFHAANEKEKQKYVSVPFRSTYSTDRNLRYS